MIPMIPSLEAANLVIGLVLAIGGTLTGVILYVVRARSGISKEISETRIQDREKIETIGARLGDVERRVNGLENIVSQMPQRDQFHQIHLDLVELKGLVTGQAEILRRVEHVVGRHEDVLLSKGAHP